MLSWIWPPAVTNGRGKLEGMQITEIKTRDCEGILCYLEVKRDDQKIFVFKRKTTAASLKYDYFIMVEPN